MLPLTLSPTEPAHGSLKTEEQILVEALEVEDQREVEDAELHLPNLQTEDLDQPQMVHTDRTHIGSVASEAAGGGCETTDTPAYEEDTR